MALSKPKKKEVLDELDTVVKENQGIVFVNFHGLSSNDVNIVRKSLKEKGVRFMVAKKTLTRKALEGAKIPGTMPEFVGELGLVYSADSLAPAREIYTFQKKLENKISILGGIFDGAFANKEYMLAIANIPSLQTLHAQFVNLINSPIQGFVMALSEIAKKKA